MSASLPVIARLRSLALIALVLGCGEGPPASTAAPPSRVQAVAAAPVLDPLADFCEVRPSADEAPLFAWPELDEAAPTIEGTWTWVNVWATWCGPCVEELPRVSGWEEKLTSDLGPGSVRFLSLDEQADAVTTFRGRHPATPPSARMKAIEGLKPFLASLGLDATAALPLQVFLDERHRVRCVRVGAVEDRDYPKVKAALSLR